jgi:hypothetical protein
LASFVHADAVTCASGQDTAGGSSGAVVINSTVTAYCGNTTGSTANAQALFSAAGTYLDTINWSANPGEGTCGDTPNYCYDPDYWNSDGFTSDTPSPPYGGGVNGTGYTYGQTVHGATTYSGNGSGTQVTNLLPVSSFLGVPDGSGGTNILSTSATGFQGLALTWDTSTTDCTVTGCPDPIYPYSSVYGVGFNVQLGGNAGDSTVQADSYQVTFEIYAATPGCTNTIDNALPPPTVDCFDYSTGVPTTADGSTDLTGAALTAATLATITVNSDDGSAGFFAVQSSVAIGAIYAMPGLDNATYGENQEGAFGIGAVTLNDQPASNTPEPATLLLFGSGLLMAARRLRKNMATK